MQVGIFNHISNIHPEPRVFVSMRYTISTQLREPKGCNIPFPLIHRLMCLVFQIVTPGFVELAMAIGSIVKIFVVERKSQKHLVSVN